LITGNGNGWRIVSSDQDDKPKHAAANSAEQGTDSGYATYTAAAAAYHAAATTATATTAAATAAATTVTATTTSTATTSTATTSTATTAAADRWPTCFSASASAAAETPGKPGEIIYLNISSILV